MVMVNPNQYKYKLHYLSFTRPSEVSELEMDCLEQRSPTYWTTKSINVNSTDYYKVYLLQVSGPHLEILNL